MSDISKIKLQNGTVLTIKDDQGRQNLQTLIDALKTAAYRDVAATISDVDGKIADAATVKAYVDAQIGTIHKFDIVIVSTLPEPSEETMYKLYLVPDITSSTGAYVEYITIRKEVTPATVPPTYTYEWERIGTTEADLTQYVKKVTKIAGVEIGSGISVTDLQNALGLQNLSYSDTASGSTTLPTIDTITMNAVTVSGDVTVNKSATDATIVAKSAYTPAGSIDVTLKDNSFNLIDVSLGTGTEAETLIFTSANQTVDVNTKTFTGTEVANLIPTQIQYNNVDSASFNKSVTPTVGTYNKTAKTISISVVPD